MFQKHASESTSSFEQRLQVMLHRMGVSKTPPADTKASQVGRSGVRSTAMQAQLEEVLYSVPGI